MVLWLKVGILVSDFTHKYDWSTYSYGNESVLTFFWYFWTFDKQKWALCLSNLAKNNKNISDKIW